MFERIRQFFATKASIHQGDIALDEDFYAFFPLAFGAGVTVYKTDINLWLFHGIFDWIPIGILPLDTSDAVIQAAAEMYYRGYQYAADEYSSTTAEERAAPDYHPEFWHRRKETSASFSSSADRSIPVLTSGGANVLSMSPMVLPDIAAHISALSPDYQPGREATLTTIITLSATSRGNGYQATVTIPGSASICWAETYPTIAEAITAAAAKRLAMPDRLKALNRAETSA